MPYFQRTGPGTFLPTEHVGGAWNPSDQHIAPALGLIVHVVETDRDRRRPGDGLVVTRLSCDILGVVPMEEFEVTVRVVRPGRSIELVEAVLAHDGRPAVLARTWLMSSRDTAAVVGGALPTIPGPDDLAPWDPTSAWPGGFIESTEVRRREQSPGRAACWVRSEVELLDEPTSPTAAAARLFDIANGITVRASPAEVAFPNIDLTAHLFREPEPGWLGFDTAVTFGPAGHGLTSSVLHDRRGPLGTLAQTLTVRPG